MINNFNYFTQGIIPSFSPYSTGTWVIHVALVVAEKLVAQDPYLSHPSSEEDKITLSNKLLHVKLLMWI